MPRTYSISNAELAQRARLVAYRQDGDTRVALVLAADADLRVQPLEITLPALVSGGVITAAQATTFDAVLQAVALYARTQRGLDP